MRYQEIKELKKESPIIKSKIKTKSKKAKTFVNYSKYKNNKKYLFYLNYIIFIQILLKIYNSSYIELTILGPGRSKIFDGRTNSPTAVYINDTLQDEVYSEYNLDYPENNVILFYNSVINMDYMFYSCSNIIRIDFSNFYSTEVNSMKNTFQNCLSLNEINLSNFDASKVRDLSYMFSGCENLKSINLFNFKTYQIKDMERMFEKCKKLEYIDISSFDISQVDNIKFMFYNCESLISINLPSITMSTVRDMSCMFMDCYSLISVDLSNLEANNLEYIGSMFKNCFSLQSVDLSKFNTENVLHMDFMFYNCISLTSLNLSNFDGSSVIWIESMFDGCQNLEYINLKNYHISDHINNINYNNIFNGIPENIFICLNEENEPQLASLIKNKACASIDITDNPSFNKKEMINLTEKCKYSCNGIYEFIYENNNRCYKDCYCVSCNTDYYPKEDEPKFNGIYFNCYHNPEGYYLDNSLYKLCYKTCKTCNSEGNNINHNCLSCNNNFPIEIINNDKINCYENCTHYYFFGANCTDYCEINDLLTKKCIIKPITNKNNEKEIIEIQDTILHKIKVLLLQVMIHLI